jgi:hypothetical protein
MRKLFALLLVAALAVPATALAAPTVEDLQKKIQELSAELEDISDRVDRNGMHTATDRISWYGDLRVKADTLHVQKEGPGVVDFDNDILYTTRLRLGMKAKVAENVGFSGRLSMYKGWADSVGAKVFDGTGNTVTMDGTNGGNTTGDFVRVERAYFDWKDIGGSNFYLSIGRRPSTYGPPSQYRENEMRGGTPSGHLVHFNFDGITVGYHLSEHTGIEGQTVRFCYGLGYESDFGTASASNPMVNVEDVHLGGFNIDAINDGTNFLQFTLFEAMHLTDSFAGLVAFGLDMTGDGIPDAYPLVRMDATNNLGNLTLGGVGFTREEDNGIKWFTSFGFVVTDPNGQGSLIPMMQGAGLMSNIPSTEKQDGYSAYVGIQVPAPAGKFGLEYNWGSRYWFNFTQSQDDLIGSKLATRGHAGEAYYIFDINPNMFIKVGGIYYDYEYTGSGSHLGTPMDIDDAKAFMPVVDTAWDGYTSLTVKF